MHTPFDFKDDGDRIVYVKTVDVADLPDEVRQQAGGRDHLYAVHNAAGEQLALVADRRMAFVLARQNDLSPVAVH
ncbi:DUF1150 domain-containing protein [Ruegeria pomeroyi]|jgi:hypothetical protein|uniref:DUF1150 family protein n=3 Tax=Ruegeria TaxID=97050 RepID=Q5LV06_RUEPO|nr:MULTISPECIES: DUF1150 family protein [Ruegeria]HCE71690.1 DUF1150 domain-containing protein [Ruegeria sp.]AAV94201.1 hypothetical protein SPO0896 [Ruegeria pomeroyi DSS-3]MCE8508228.1 DUF1150 family protein [Ruegeria pomeroyi]MCE8512931.1 DUF1150 family protein [Ruegeria pomeroyi]MCE8516041.1 DUF1150 family protein [Ruegeria pomeroyi]